MELEEKQFFSTARERYRIRERRLAGLPREEWTEDHIYRDWRFCNVFREHDRTTEWFARNIRSKVSGFDAIFAVVAFRWFNRIETGHIIKDLLLSADSWSSSQAAARLKDVSPVVTGAYIIKGWDGYSKLDGVLKCIDSAIPHMQKWDWQNWLSRDFPLMEAWEDLRTLTYMGPFMAYEAVSDIRWTPVLAGANDINLWANAGPGAKRGLGWVFNNDSSNPPRDELAKMNLLLSLSRSERHWPTEWPAWEMREVEHWLCEFDKYKRAERGDRLKRRYQS